MVHANSQTELHGAQFCPAVLHKAPEKQDEVSQCLYSPHSTQECVQRELMIMVNYATQQKRKCFAFSSDNQGDITVPNIRLQIGMENGNVSISSFRPSWTQQPARITGLESGPYWSYAVCTLNVQDKYVCICQPGEGILHYTAFSAYIIITFALQTQQRIRKLG